MRLFPYALVRVAGGPFHLLSQLRAPETEVLLQRIAENRAAYETARDALCEAVFAAVPAVEDAGHQKKMINLKREIYNGRVLSPQKVELLQRYLSPEGLALLEEVTALQREAADLDAAGAHRFAKESAAAREALHGLSRMDVLTKGLVLSSQTLLKSLPGYCKKGYGNAKKKDLKTELSLLQYLTRICAKTSPFSTFTNLVMAQVQPGQEAVASSHESAPQARGEIRLNNTLFKYLTSLLTSHPVYRRHIPLRPNPTLTREEETYLFLINHNNVESFQRVPLNPVLDLFWDLANGKPEGVTMGEMIASALEMVDASDEDMAAYILQLLEYGFLEYNLGISGLDTDWDLKLSEKLKLMADDLPLRNDLIDVLGALRGLADQYADADFKGRIGLLNQAYDLFHGVCFKLHEDAGLPEEERLKPEDRQAFLRRKAEAQKTEQAEEEAEASPPSDAPEGEVEETEEEFKRLAGTTFFHKPEQMFYEDCVLTAPFQCGADVLQATLGVVDELADRLGILDGSLDERAAMTWYFNNNYTDEVDVLSFYEHYYRDYKKPEEEFRQKRTDEVRKRAEDAGKSTEEGTPVKPKPTPPKPFAEVPERDACEAARQKFGVGLADALKELPFAPELNLPMDAVDQIVDTLEPEHRYALPRSSCAAFVQFVGQGDQQQVMINSLPHGYGKLFSRFMHLFDPAVTEALRQDSQEIHPEAHLLEDHDASTFNANLHPPLLSYEVWMPGGHNALPAEQQVPVTEMVVRRTEAGIELRNGKTDALLYVFDLGFQGEIGRSPLFRMLKRFSPAAPFYLQQVTSSFLKHLRKPDQVYLIPRITLGDRVIIQRKTWVIPQAQLPQRTPEDNAWTYYRKVRLWQRSLDLPDHAFVNITQRWELDNLPADKRAKVRRDDYKPQYIDFASPLVVRLFEKLVERVPVSMRVVEMLPAPEDMVRLGGDAYVTEAVVQWRRDGKES